MTSGVFLNYFFTYCLQLLLRQGISQETWTLLFPLAGQEGSGTPLWLTFEHWSLRHVPSAWLFAWCRRPKLISHQATFPSPLCHNLSLCQSQLGLRCTVFYNEACTFVSFGLDSLEGFCQVAFVSSMTDI